ncbi:LCP family protein [Cerasibacillus sp. JNUCC 74]|jgi:polyisoprenyl-teichoic acid--peptidoglycan teichoic acid transferase|uniref:LCP family protein n=1 Tax=Virgibacillus proomii TaxID=84407 RepID=UPI000984BF02|nr:LCP family protein [Virgibacillus proomii]
MSKNRENIYRVRNHKKKKRKKRLLFLIIPLSLLLIGAASYGIYVYNTAQEAADDSYEGIGRNGEKSKLRDEAVTPIEDNVSVLIIGVDDTVKRDFKGKSRSDALMLATFNKQQKDVNILSIPRDSYVNVPDYGFTKINHAYFYGGPKKTIETVENFLNVPVDYYVRLNFEAFIEIIDTIGGIQYDVPFAINELDSNDNPNAVQLNPGYQTLNGEEALALARTRKYDSKEAATASSILKVDELIKAVGDNMSTNLSFNEMKSFISYGLNNSLAINTINLEGTGTKLNDGLWYYQVDEQSRSAAENQLRDHLNFQTTTPNGQEYTQETSENL